MFRGQSVGIAAKSVVFAGLSVDSRNERSARFAPGKGRLRMKLVTFRWGNAVQVGVMNAALDAVHPVPGCGDLAALIASGAEIVPSAEALPLTEVTLLSPIPHPGQDVICLGINYYDHAAESDTVTGKSDNVPKNPIYFSKRVNEAVAPGGAIDSHSDIVDDLDYEAELAVVIGRAAYNVSKEDALDYVFGYTILNDVSARAIQSKHQQWYRGKSLDGFTPIGPWIVTKDEFDVTRPMKIQSYVNGELRQNSTIDMLIFDTAYCISELSHGMTLLPGTILSMGTPAGVGMGFHPPKWLRPGDTVRCVIEGIGALENTVE